MALLAPDEVEAAELYRATFFGKVCYGRKFAVDVRSYERCASSLSFFGKVEECQLPGASQ